MESAYKWQLPYAHDLDFERAIECRDRIKSIQREIKYKNEK